MREFARYRNDATTAGQADKLINNVIVQASIQTHLWQPKLGFYLGDTIKYCQLWRVTVTRHSNDDVTICQHVFTLNAPYVLQQTVPLVLSLSTPCKV